VENEKILIAEAVVNIKLLATRLSEMSASHDTSPEEFCDMFDEIENLARSGAHYSSYIYWSKYAVGR
jgi:hypothetical protein